MVIAKQFLWLLLGFMVVVTDDIDTIFGIDTLGWMNFLDWVIIDGLIYTHNNNQNNGCTIYWVIAMRPASF